MQIDRFMTKEVFTCQSSDSLDVAAKIMWDHDCGCVPVVDSERRVVGMLTDRDICMAAYTQGRALVHIRVASAMAKEVFSCRLDESPQNAERIMQEHQVRRLPVVDAEGRLAGILSLYDLACEALRESGHRFKAVHPEEIDCTLAAISRRPKSDKLPDRARIEH